MTVALVPVQKPPPPAALSPQQILLGPYYPPQDQIKLYSPKEFGAFILEWAFYYLQQKAGEYAHVENIDGSGDKGRDIFARLKTPQDGFESDIYQCKHYEHPLQPDDALVEVMKVCYHTHVGDYSFPRKYIFVALRDVGPKLSDLLKNPKKLKTRLLREWPKHARKLGRSFPRLSAELKDHINKLDFSRITFKPIHEIIAEHAKTIVHARRFGGGLRVEPPEDLLPPDLPVDSEATYVAELLGAYADKLGETKFTLDNFVHYERFRHHFKRSRERFYSAEAVRQFARDALPSDMPKNLTFEGAQDSVYWTVVDIADQDYQSAFERVDATVNLAPQTKLTYHPLEVYLSPKALQGICHQLVNAHRLRWVRK